MLAIFFFNPVNIVKNIMAYIENTCTTYRVARSKLMKFSLLIAYPAIMRSVTNPLAARAKITNSFGIF